MNRRLYVLLESKYCGNFEHKFTYPWRLKIRKFFFLWKVWRRRATGSKLTVVVENSPIIFQTTREVVVKYFII